MRYLLENEELIIEIDSFGAELRSVKEKKTGKEYMWQADKTFWGRTSPVLFPFVGSLKEKQYTWEGIRYPMGQHGFARDMEHQLLSQEKQEIWFCLKSTEETMEKYPFSFVLSIGYRLEERCVSVLWKVDNPGKKTMYFSIGAHPAFFLPLQETKEDSENYSKDKEGYRIYFGGVNEIHHHGNTLDTGLAVKEDLVLPLHNGEAVITKEFFDRCTYMIEGKQTKEVGLVTPAGRRFVTVKFDAPLFAIWSPEGKNAPFVCIEPWYGRCDGVDFDGDLSEREFTNVLQAGETFRASYQMEFN